MQRRFSEQLMKKAKTAFEKKSGLSLTDDEVEIYLDKLGQFGLLYAKIICREMGDNPKTNEINRKKI